MPQYEFGSGDKAIADEVREEFDEHLSGRDDARTLTVRIADKAPEGVKTEIEARATESKRESESRSVMGSPLSEGVREKIKDENGFDANTTVFSWRRAKGVFQREGLMNRWGESISALARDYDDPKEGAEDIIARGREADMMKGTSSVSSEMDMGEEDVIEDQKAADAARTVQSEQCNHAEGHCENGQPEACEFLQETCGYSEEMTQELLDTPGSLGVGATTKSESTENQTESSENQERGTDTDTDTDAGQPDIDDRTVDDASDWDTSQLTGKEAGALSRSLQGYYGATDQIEESIEEYLKPEWQNAQDAANTIQEIRMKYDAGRQHFKKLEELQARFKDFVEQMAQDCKECHADHSGHDHDTDMSEREDIRNFAEGGGNATPVGAADETEAAALEAPDRMAGMQQETIDPGNRQSNATMQDRSQSYDRTEGMQQGPLPGSRQRVEGAAARARTYDRDRYRAQMPAGRSLERERLANEDISLGPEEALSQTGAYGENTEDTRRRTTDTDEQRFREQENRRAGFNRMAGMQQETIDPRGRQTNARQYDPTDEYEQVEESSSIQAMGAGRRKNIDAIDAKGRLSEVESFDSIQQMLNAIREISLARRDGRTYMKPPERPLQAIENTYQNLPTNAQPEFLSDSTLIRRINAARNAFNDYLSRLKRREKMPSPIESGPANYPADKARQVSESARNAKQNLEERLDRVRAGANGARQRALNAIGTSVGEQNERQREQLRTERRDEYEKGDIAIWSSPRMNVWGVKRVNKKSLRLRKPYTAERRDIDYEETRAELDKSRLVGPLTDYEVRNINSEEDQDIMDEGRETTANLKRLDSDSPLFRADSLDELRVMIHGEEWLDENVESISDVEQTIQPPTPDRMAGMQQETIDPRGRRVNVRQRQQPQNVLEQETQQTLGGGQADPQQTFARDRVGQPNQRESELESAATVGEVNSGGMTADTRSDDAMSETRTTEEATEQQIPDAFITRDDGNQQGLGEVSSESESESSEMSLDTAIEMLDGMTDGYGDRVSMDAAIGELLVEKFDVPQSVWSEKNSQDVFRYGLPAEDVRRELNDEYQSQIEDAIIRLAQEQRAIQ